MEEINFSFKRNSKFINHENLQENLEPTQGKKPTLPDICCQLNGKHLDKKEFLSNCENNHLRDAQIYYAALNGYIFIEIKENFETLARTLH
jgi:hypothetical protein